MRIIGVDPGPRESGVVLLDAGDILSAEVMPNDAAKESIGGMCWGGADMLAIEAFKMYGARGDDSRDTIIWTGRFIETAAREATDWMLVERHEARQHLCPGCKHVGDPDVRSAIIDRFGGKDTAIGTKKNKGVLYGVKSHAWAALAVALVARDRLSVLVPGDSLGSTVGLTGERENAV